MSSVSPLSSNEVIRVSDLDKRSPNFPIKYLAGLHQEADLVERQGRHSTTNALHKFRHTLYTGTLHEYQIINLKV